VKQPIAFAILVAAFVGFPAFGFSGGQPSGAAREAGVELVATFIGNEAWSITDGRDVVLTDFPYESGAFGYMKWNESAIPKPPEGARTVLIVTHTHRDHFAPELVSKIPGQLVALFGPADARAAVSLAAPPGSQIPATPINALSVRSIETPHANREHSSYVLEWHGVRFYLPGDTGDAKSLLEQRNLDIAFVTPWLLRTIEKRRARIDASRIVVVHHTSDEDVRPYQGSVVTRQGEVLRLRARSAAR
jgi:L-ascorbate metabolism protein UlaG (beta-lactamase superfamily)